MAGKVGPSEEHEDHVAKVNPTVGWSDHALIQQVVWSDHALQCTDPTAGWPYGPIMH